MIKRLLYLALTMFLIVGCGSDDKVPVVKPEEEALKTFLTTTTEGAYVKGANTLVYDQATHQVAVNPTALIYRLQNDSQTLYLQTKLSSRPAAEGDQVTVTTTARGVTSVISGKNYAMKTVKISGNKFWLWDATSITGFVVSL